MTNSGKGDVFWAWTGKIGAIAALVLSVIGIISWWRSPSTSLRAEIETGSFHLPPRYSDFQESVKTAIAPENIDRRISEILKKEFNSKDVRDDWSLLSLEMSRKLAADAKLIEQSTANPYQKYWVAPVTNEGELPVSDVSLRLPGSTVAIIEKEDGTRSKDDKGPTIEIGQVTAGQEIKVYAWADGYFFSTDDPAIFHAGGSGTARITNETSFSNAIASNLFQVVFYGLMLLMLTLAGIGWYTSRQLRLMLTRQAEKTISRKETTPN